jgi:hypothetical protein
MGEVEAMIVYVTIAAVSVTAGATIGVSTQRLRRAWRAQRLFARTHAVASGGSTLPARLTISLLPDDSALAAGQLTSAAALTIILLPDQPGEPWGYYPGEL